MKTPLVMSYPAVFTREEAGGYFIEFPDIQGAYTGINEENIPLAMTMAEEVLGMVLADMIESEEKLPTPSDISSFLVESDQFVTFIKVDVEQYLKDQTLMKKTLTIPKWANDLGNRLGINFSKVLTDAISEQVYTRFHKETNK